MTDKYILEDGIPVPATDLLSWGKWMEKANRRVAFLEIGNVQVSTVFLGLDHSFGNGNPILFETMIFNGEHDQYQERYDTLENAMAGHERAVALVKGEQA